MMTEVKRLTPEAKEALRRRFLETEETRWVTDLAARRGWREANRRYLESMREQGVREMAALMEELSVSGIVSSKDALELMETAFSIYLPEAEIERTTDDLGQPALAIRVENCPTYTRIERSDWHGVTACGSWHRRQGWYQALDINAADSVVGEKKWGDVACAALVSVPPDDAPVAMPSARA